MSFEAASYLEFMPSTVSIQTRAGSNNYGEPSVSTTVTKYRARITFQPHEMRRAGGEVVAVKNICWVASTGTINATDKITLPDGSTPTILAVQTPMDADGNHHNKLMLGWS